MAEIDIQQMIKDYNRILQKDYYGPYAKYDTWDQQARGNLDLLDEIKKFKQRYSAVEENFSLDDMPAKATLLKIEQNGKDIILPNFNSSNFTQMNGEDKVLEEMFESGHKEGDLSKDIKLDRPAIFTFDENGQYIKGERGKLTLYDGGSYYFRGENDYSPESETHHTNEQTSISDGSHESASNQERNESPSAKPEPIPETPVNIESPSQSSHRNTPSGSSYDFNNAKQNMRDEIFGVKEDKEKGIEAKKGIEAEHKYLTDPKLRESRRSSMQNEDVVSIKRFNRAREYYKQNRDRIQAIDEHLNNARASFSEQEQKELLSDKNIKNINKALNEAKAEYDSAVLDAKRAGTKVPEYNSENINKQVAQKVFGNTDIESINAVQYADLKTTGDNLKARFQRRNDIIGRAIDPALKRNENKIARGPRAGSSGWKGKAAIFGGVALGALALVGVASMVMSGGRQQNSNLYNPYQAMY